MRQRAPSRCGIRIRGHGGNAVVRRALIKYANWLRRNYEFPIRVPVYLSPREELVTAQGETAVATFFAPWDRETEPYIRIATGDYAKLRGSDGRDGAVAAYLLSLSHEVVHYRQWVETGDVWEQGVLARARAMVNRYMATVPNF